MGGPITVGRVSEIPPGSCLHVDAKGREVALFNVDGTIFAIGGSCTHLGGGHSEKAS